MGGEGASHGAASGAAGARLMTTGETDWSTASVMEDAKAVDEGLDSWRGDCAQQSSAAAWVTCVLGAASS